MKVLKLFLASSSELKKDRGEFRVFISEENKVLVKRNLFIQVELWEDFIDSMAQSSLQDTYNRAVRSCDFFVMLFYSKVGKYTREEFETAFGQFQETNKPFIYTYFKNSTIRIGDLKRDDIQSLWEFQDRLQALGHYQTLYENMGTLKLHFKNQLHKHLATMETKSKETNLSLAQKYLKAEKVFGDLVRKAINDKFKVFQDFRIEGNDFDLLLKSPLLSTKDIVFEIKYSASRVGGQYFHQSLAQFKNSLDYYRQKMKSKAEGRLVFIMPSKALTQKSMQYESLYDDTLSLIQKGNRENRNQGINICYLDYDKLDIYTSDEIISILKL